LVGSGIRKKIFPDSGSRGQKASYPGSGSATRDIVLKYPINDENWETKKRALRTTENFDLLHSVMPKQKYRKSNKAHGKFFMSNQKFLEFFKDKKSKRSHKRVKIKVFLTKFA
jgi:hypothetical protein